MSKTIADSVEKHLCTQCGACVAACPVDAIVMRETPAGMLTPVVDVQACLDCGKCWLLCPGARIEVNLPETISPFQGAVFGAYAGHACAEDVRSRGQSGGVVSALLLYLLESAQIDAAVVSSLPPDGSLRANPVLARTRRDVLAASGSKYCPVALNEILGDIPSGDRVAVVGLSCHMHGIHALRKHAAPLVKNIEYTVGLFCDRTMLYTAIDSMAQKAGVDLESVSGLEYRSKARRGWPGEVRFLMASGQDRFFPSSLRTRLKDYFTVPRCRVCFDKMNIFSDVSVGDAWGISESSEGESVVIARNEKGDALLARACAAGFLDLRPVDPEAIFRGQVLDAKQRDFAAFMQAWRDMIGPAPVYEGLDLGSPLVHDAVVGTACRKKLAINLRVAASPTRKQTAATVQRMLAHERYKALLTKPFAPLARAARRIRSVVSELVNRANSSLA